jgi:hypothetical protein
MDSTQLEMALTAADWIPSSSQPYRTLIDKSAFDVYYQKRNDRVYEVVKPLEKSQMNRNYTRYHFLGSLLHAGWRTA